MLHENKRVHKRLYFRGARKFGEQKLEEAKMYGMQKLRKLR